MFKPKRVLKVSVLGLNKEKEWFVSRVQKLGLLHLSDLSDKIKFDKAYNKLSHDVPLPEVESIGGLLLRVNLLRETFRERLGKVGVSPELPGTFSLRSAIAECESVLSVFEQDAVAVSKELNELDAIMRSKSDELEFFRKFELDFVPADTKTVKFIFGRVLKSDFDKFKFSPEFRRKVIVAKNVLSKESYGVMVCFAFSDESFVLQTLRSLNFEREKTVLSGSSPDIVSSELLVLKKSRDSLLSSLRKLYERNCSGLEYAYCILSIAKERAEASLSFGRTKGVFYVEAFIPAESFDSLSKLLSNRNVVLVSVVPEDAPILLHDVKYVKAYKIVTTMFGLPVYNGIDPTFFVSLFFPFFFGFMLSDAGYGALLGVGALAFYLARSKNLIFKDISIIAGASALSTVIFGILFGSFFGGLVAIPILWLDPFKQAMTILTVAIAVGLLHVNLGILLSAITNVVSKQYKKFVVENCSLWLLQLGALGFVLNANIIGGLLLGLGVALLIVKSSLFGIMEVSGFAGVILSYARLLALCLATGGIALAVNIMAGQIGSLGAVGLVLAPIVLILGHGFNFVINIIGSTVNASRLHFVEFFSLFFVEGGEEFKPFKIKQFK